jgi:O-antigen/teichoic acid export membrane protein
VQEQVPQDADTSEGPSARRVLAKGLILVGAATLVGNGAAFIFNSVAARALTPAEFGAFGAMLGFLIIVSTLSLAIQALTARRVAVAAPGEERSRVEGEAIRLAVVVGIAITIFGFAVSWPLGILYDIPYWALVMGVASLSFVVFGTASMGIAQGREQHIRLSIGFISNGLGRALVGIIFVLIFPSIIGASVGMLLGCALGAIISYLVIAPRVWSRSLIKGGYAEFGHIAHALLVLFTLTNIDVQLARIFLTPDMSGEYAVGVLLAKIAFFLPNAIVIVLFPKMSNGDNRRAVYVATALTAVVGVFITIFSFLFGDFVIGVLGGKQYVELGNEAWLFALEGSAFALVQVLLYARLAAQDRKAVAMVWVALVALVTAVVFFFHDTVAQIVITVVVVSLALTIVGLFLDRRSVPKDVSIPIEAAE